MGKRITEEEFRKSVFDLVGNEYVFLEKYNGVDNKITVKHNVCGHKYQGIQHYKAVSIFGGIDGYNKRVMYDNVKRNYCKNNHIELIEIPYYYDDEKIFNTIKEKLCQS